jgi:branched-subunit amino acid transport protein
MADWEIWLAIAGLGLATASTRSVFLLIGHRLAIPPRIQQLLRFAPGCALAAIIAPDILLGPGGELQIGLSNPKLLGGAAALGYYLWRRNMLQTIVFGMLVFTLLRLFPMFGNVS